MEVEKIYFDMDGVLADFERGVKEICGLLHRHRRTQSIISPVRMMRCGKLLKLALIFMIIWN